MSNSEAPPKTKIFVGKLPPNCKDFELQKLFDSYGQVTECTVLGNYAFVHMKTEEEALTAIQNLNNWELNGFKISVEQSTGEKRSGGMRGGRGGRGGGGRGMRGGLGFRGGSRGGMGPLRGGSRGGGMRPSPYDRRPPVDERYGPPPAIRNGYYDDYERRPERRPPPTYPAPVERLERRPLPPPRDHYRSVDPYDRYESYERISLHPAPLRRSPPPTISYSRREDPYAHDVYSRAAPIATHDDVYATRDPYVTRARSPLRRSPPRRYAGIPPPRDLPPRRY